MKITITRTGYNTPRSPFRPRQRYDLYLNGFPEEQRMPGHIEFGFITNASGLRQSDFHGHIMPGEFVELAAAMMAANPDAAIRAFGAALQNFKTAEKVEEAA